MLCYSITDLVRKLFFRDGLMANQAFIKRQLKIIELGVVMSHNLVYDIVILTSSNNL